MTTVTPLVVEGSGLFFAKILLQQYILVFGLWFCLEFYTSTGKELGLPLDKIARTATRTVSIHMILAPFALTQALGGSTGIFTWGGLLLATLPFLVNTVIAIVGPLLTGTTLNVNETTCLLDTEGDCPFPAEALAKPWKMLKFLPIVSLLGGLMLTLAEFPGGVCLACSSICLRLALLVKLVILPGMALPMVSAKLKAAGIISSAVQTADSITLCFVPIVSALALADHAVSGPSSGLLALIHPALYYMLWQLSQFAAAVAIPVVLKGSVRGGEIMGDFECQVEKDEIGMKLVFMRKLANLVLYSMLAFMTLRLVLALFSLGVSMDGIVFSSGPLFLLALLAALLIFVIVYIALFLLKVMKEVGGYEVPMLTRVVQELQAVAAFCPVVALTIIAIYAEMPATSSGIAASIMRLITFPTTYGIMLSAGAITCQVAAIVAAFLFKGHSFLPLNDGFAWPNLDGIIKLKLICFSSFLCGLLLGWVQLGLLVWIVMVAPVVAINKDKVLVALQNGKEAAKPALANAKDSVNKFATGAAGPKKQLADVAVKILDALEKILQGSPASVKADEKSKKKK